MTKTITKIIMVRHGQSQANAQSRFAGHSDFDLTELGKQQAQKAAEYLIALEKLDAIYSSDLLRAHNTALPFSNVFGLPVNDTADLREIYAGKWEGMQVDQIHAQYKEDFDVWHNDFAMARCTGGESVTELYERIVASVCKIASKHPNQTLLLATHATPVRAIECYSHGLSAEHMGEIAFVRNSALSIFEYHHESGQITSIKTNITDHLTDELQSKPTDIEKAED